MLNPGSVIGDFPCPLISTEKQLNLFFNLVITKSNIELSAPNG